MGKLRECWIWLKSLHTGPTVWFFYETTLPFCFVQFGSKSSLVYIIFWTCTQSASSYIPPTRDTGTRLMSSMPPTQLTRHVRQGNTCVLYTLWNKCISFHATRTIYMAFPLGRLCCVDFRKQVRILLWHPHNLCSMSKESSKESSRYPTLWLCKNNKANEN